MSKIKLRREIATEAIADIFQQIMNVSEAHYCSVAGSLRRQRAYVGDVEIVCVPKRQLDLFGDPGESLLPQAVEAMISEGLLSRPTKNGDNYKQFVIKATGQNLDLFITSKEQWPVIFAIRTGGADFSRKLVTPRAQGGLLPSNLRVSGGFVWDNGQRVELESERAFLELCGGWVAPEDRR